MRRRTQQTGALCAASSTSSAATSPQQQHCWLLQPQGPHLSPEGPKRVVLASYPGVVTTTRSIVGPSMAPETGGRRERWKCAPETARQRLGRVGKGGGASAGKLHARPCFQSQSSAMDALICNLLNHPRQTEGQDAETQQRVVVVSQPQPPFCTRVPGNLGGRAWLQPQGTVSPGQQCLPTLMASHNVGRTDSPPNTPAPLPPPTPAPPALAGWRWSAAASACAASLLDGHSAVRVQQPHDGGRLLRAARAARVMLL